MATKVLKELAVVVSTYEDRDSGATKNRYENIGVMMESTNDRGERNTFLMLKRTFNPAGVLFKPGSDKILISMFDPKSNDGQAPQKQDTQAGGYGQQSARPSDKVFDDEIPF